MRFVDFQFAAAAPASADPRTSPGTVPDALIAELPKTLPNTDTSPPYLGLVLEGTAAQTMDVTLWALAEGPSSSFDPGIAASERKFYKVGATVTLTVGTMKTLPAVPGKFYLQSSGGPAAASVLRIAPMAAPIP